MAAPPTNSPCAGCKFLRRKCLPDCIFAPYFPPDQPQKFANVHKVFGASNVTKLLHELHPQQREDAVNSLSYEADMRLRDPVYGCVGVISLLQHQLRQLQMDLNSAKSELYKYHHHQSDALNYVLINGTTTTTTMQYDNLNIAAAAGAAATATHHHHPSLGTHSDHGTNIGGGIDLDGGSGGGGNRDRNPCHQHHRPFLFPTIRNQQEMMRPLDDVNHSYI